MTDFAVTKQERTIMQNKLDIKSLGLGVAMGAIIVLSVSAASTSGASYGRYQLVVAEPANYAPVIYKIDTSTGQIWRSNAGGPSAEFMAPNSAN